MVKVIAPYRPGMATGVFIIRVLYLYAVELSHHNLAVFIGDVFLPSHCYPKQFEVCVYERSIRIHKIVLGVSDPVLHGHDPAGTEYTEPGKLIRIFYTGVKRMDSSHGKPRQRAVGSTGFRTV